MLASSTPDDCGVGAVALRLRQLQVNDVQQRARIATLLDEISLQKNARALAAIEATKAANLFSFVHISFGQLSKVFLKVEEMERRNRELLEQIESLKNDRSENLSQLRLEKASSSGLSITIQTLQSELREERTLRTNADQKLYEYREEIAKLSEIAKTIEPLQRELRNQREQSARLAQDLSGVTASRDSNAKEAAAYLDRARERILELELELRQREERVREVSSESEILQSRVHEAEERAENERRERQQYISRTVENRGEIEALKSRLEIANADCETFRERERDHEYRIEHLERNLIESQISGRRALEQLDEAKSSLKKYSADAKAAREEADDARRNYENQKHELFQLRIQRSSNPPTNRENFDQVKHGSDSGGKALAEERAVNLERALADLRTQLAQEAASNRLLDLQLQNIRKDGAVAAEQKRQLEIQLEAAHENLREMKGTLRETEGKLAATSRDLLNLTKLRAENIGGADGEPLDFKLERFARAIELQSLEQHRQTREELRLALLSVLPISPPHPPDDVS